MSLTLDKTVEEGLNIETVGTKNEVQVLDEQQMLAYNTKYKAELRQLPEVEKMTSEININDTTTILNFGQGAAQGISQVSDKLLSTMKAVKAEEAGEMVQQLAKVIDKFDSQELANIKEPSGLQKLFNNTKRSLEKIFEKYDNMGKEVDGIYKILQKYDKEIEESNQALKQLYDANINYYQQLEKYIVAGEIALEELDTELIPEYQEKANQGDNLANSTLQQLTIVREMVEQRVYDLRIAENIALQTIPMIQGIQYSNFNLTRKINSAFIITLPIFKQCLAQTILIKRQEIQAKSLKALDDKTNELLIRNAQNMVAQTTNIARMAGSSSIQMETLEKTWETIKNGIEETRHIEQENRTQRVANTQKLENMKYEMMKIKK